MQRIDLKTGFMCNNNCLFCVQAHKKKFGNKSSALLKKCLKDSADLYQGVVFTGGEATIREDIFELVSYAKKLGFAQIQMQTNGRRLFYRDFCEKLVKSGVNEFCVSIHGHIPELHDYLTTSRGSFDQTLGGIKNLLKMDQRVITNTVIVKSNFRHLPEISRMLVDAGVRRIQFAFVHIMGNVLSQVPSLVPRKTLIAPYVKKAIDIGIKAGADCTTEAIPHCFLIGYVKHIAENSMPETKIFDLDYTIESFTKVRQQESKTKGPCCHQCGYFKRCEGPWREYPEIFGWDEFKPVIFNDSHSRKR